MYRNRSQIIFIIIFLHLFARCRFTWKLFEYFDETIVEIKYLIVMNVSQMVSRTEWACACDMRLRFLTSCLRSFAFFWSPLSWLYISGVSAKSLYTYWPATSAAGFGGGVGLCLSRSAIRHSTRKRHISREISAICLKHLRGFKLGSALPSRELQNGKQHSRVVGNNILSQLSLLTNYVKKKNRECCFS